MGIYDYIPPVSAPDESADPPSGFLLLNAYPNPFNSTVTIRFAIPTASNVKLTVHNIAARMVGEIINSRLLAGQHATVWDGSGLPTGVYIVRLVAAGEVKTVKGVIVK